MINAAGQDSVEAFKRIASGDRPTTVFDATGNAESMAASFEFPSHGGQLILVGLFPGDLTFNDPDFHRRELTIRASRNACPENFSHIIDLVEAKRIDTAPWITHRVAFDDLIAEFPR